MAPVVFVLAMLLAVFFMLRKEEEAFPTVIVGFFLAFMTAIFVDMPVNYFTHTRTEVNYSLGALADGNKTEGRFFLGTGTIDSTPSFTYYERHGDAYILTDWPGDSSRVVETSEKPYVTYDCPDYRTVPAPFRWTAYMVFDEDLLDCNHATVTFHVPPGSIQQNYTLDAK